MHHQFNYYFWISLTLLLLLPKNNSNVSSFSIIRQTAVPTRICLQQEQKKQRNSITYRQRHHDSILSKKIKNANTALFADQAITKADTETEENDDDDEEWEYEEYEMLTETDFYNSEWKVGTLMDGDNKIIETWTRLIVKDGEFICIWGDGSKGKWNFDPASQFLSMSKDSYGGWLGKRIWAGNVDDFYYVQGTIRGWSPISPASVVGQWQAKRLGVDKEEAGIAPWFEENDEDEEEKQEESEDEK